MSSEVTIVQAMDKLIGAMADDMSYAWSWHCNIAVAMQDYGMSHIDSNNYAVIIMRRLFGIDTTECEEYQYFGDEE